MKFSIVNRTARLRFTVPFDKKFKKDPKYRVLKEQSYSSFREDGGKIEDLYSGITNWESIASADEVLGTRILTMVSDKGDRIAVPESYVKLFDSSDMKEYSDKTLVIRLGSFPSDQDFAPLITELKGSIKALIGVRATVAIADTSRTAMVSSAEHDAVVALRKANSSSDVLSNHALREEVSKLKVELANLEEYITKCL